MRVESQRWRANFQCRPSLWYKWEFSQSSNFSNWWRVWKIINKIIAFTNLHILCNNSLFYTYLFSQVHSSADIIADFLFLLHYQNVHLLKDIFFSLLAKNIQCCFITFAKWICCILWETATIHKYWLLTGISSKLSWIDFKELFKSEVGMGKAKTIWLPLPNGNGNIINKKTD